MHPSNLPTRLALSLTLTLAATVFAGGFALAQCTDSDADGFYYEAGCGTDRDCNDADAAIHPGAEPASTQVAFYLAAGITDSVEGSLGTDGSGLERPNDDPCP